MDNYRQIPARVQAVHNVFNTPQEMADSLGEMHTVPPGWWLVEALPGMVAMVSDAAFSTTYEAWEPYATLNSFVSTVGDLRETDRMAVQRSMDLEARIANLKALVSAARTALSPQVV